MSLTLHDAWCDLVLGSGCAACGTPGRLLCGDCRSSLPSRGLVCWPTPTPPGLVPPWAAGDHAGALRDLIVAHKEHRRLGLAGPLGRLLAVSVEAAVESVAGDGVEAGARGAPALVPVPSHPAVVRERGHDPLLRIARQAAVALRRRGREAAVRPLLRVAERPRDQAGLDAEERAANVRGRFAFRGPPLTGKPLVLVDDVLTTGATLREAQRVLTEAGQAPCAAGVVAATRRRAPPAGAPSASR